MTETPHSQCGVPGFYLWLGSHIPQASQVVLVVKNLPANDGDIRDSGSIPGSGRCPGTGNGTPLQHSCLENPHGQRSLVASSTVHGVAQSRIP